VDSALGTFHSDKQPEILCMYVMTQKVYILWLGNDIVYHNIHVGSGTKVISVVDAFGNNVMVR